MNKTSNSSNFIGLIEQNIVLASIWFSYPFWKLPFAPISVNKIQMDVMRADLSQRIHCVFHYKIKMKKNVHQILLNICTGIYNDVIKLNIFHLNPIVNFSNLYITHYHVELMDLIERYKKFHFFVFPQLASNHRNKRIMKQWMIMKAFRLI